MTSDMRTVIYPVKDLEGAKAVFGALLGTAPAVDQPYYVQFSVDGLDVGLDPNGHAQGMTGPVCYWTDAPVVTAADRDALFVAQRSFRRIGASHLARKLPPGISGRVSPRVAFVPLATTNDHHSG